MSFLIGNFLVKYKGGSSAKSQNQEQVLEILEEGKA